MVFVSAFLLVYSFVVPVFGAERKAADRLKKRLRAVAQQRTQKDAAGMLREKYLRQLSPLERAMESLPGMDRLALSIEQSGRQSPAYRVVLLAVVLALAAGVLVYAPIRNQLLL